MLLQEKLNEYKKGFEAKAPREVLDIMHRATEDLKKSGILDLAAKPGDQAPDFSLENTDGQKVTLSGLLEDGPVVLGFYRGQW